MYKPDSYEECKFEVAKAVKKRRNSAVECTAHIFFGPHGFYQWLQHRNHTAIIFFLIISLSTTSSIFVYLSGLWPFIRNIEVIQSKITNRGIIVKIIPSWHVKDPTLFCSFDSDKGRHYTQSNETVGNGGPDDVIMDGNTLTIEVVFGKKNWQDMPSEEFKKLVKNSRYIYCKMTQSNLFSLESNEFIIYTRKN